MARHFNRRTFLAASGAALCVLPQVAHAAGTSTAGTAAQPTPITGPMSGYLPGNSGGSFAYYQFSYGGQNTNITLTLTTDRSAPLTSKAAGINVYQNSILRATSNQSGPTSATAIFSSSFGGLVIVQVFDYDAANPINYTLSATGLPPQPAATAMPAATVAPAAASGPTTAPVPAAAPGTTTSVISPPPTPTSVAPATTPTVLTGSVNGTLAGAISGRFVLYLLNYPGNNQDVTLTLTVSPSTDLTFGAAGLNVYGPSGSLVGSAVPTVTSGISTLKLINAAATTYTLQVYNYDATTTISYTLSESGI